MRRPSKTPADHHDHLPYHEANSTYRTYVYQNSNCDIIYFKLWILRRSNGSLPEINPPHPNYLSMKKADQTMAKRQYIILLSSLYVIFMIFVTVYSFETGNQFSGSVGLAGILCGAVPILLMILTRLKLDLPLVITYLIFLFGSQFLGSILNWYHDFSWWDLLLHGLSGMIIAFFAMAIYKKLVLQRVNGQVSSGFLFLFILSFAAFCGVLWEIYEFSCGGFRCDYAERQHRYDDRSDSRNDRRAYDCLMDRNKIKVKLIGKVSCHVLNADAGAL